MFSGILQLLNNYGTEERVKSAQRLQDELLCIRVNFVEVSHVRDLLQVAFHDLIAFFDVLTLLTLSGCSAKWLPAA